MCKRAGVVGWELGRGGGEPGVTVMLWCETVHGAVRTAPGILSHMGPKGGGRDEGKRVGVRSPEGGRLRKGAQCLLDAPF